MDETISVRVPEWHRIRAFPGVTQSLSDSCDPLSANRMSTVWPATVSFMYSLGGKDLGRRRTYPDSPMAFRKRVGHELNSDESRQRRTSEATKLRHLEHHDLPQGCLAGRRGAPDFSDLPPREASGRRRSLPSLGTSKRQGLIQALQSRGDVARSCVVEIFEGLSR